MFAVLVATSFARLDAFAVLVFAAPLMFARQMFQRTHSLQEATDELAEKQAENEHQAMHDSLTGLPNRLLFQLELAEAIERTRAAGGTLGVMLIDLDHFKEINDTLGHHFGDLLLQEIGPRLSRRAARRRRDGAAGRRRVRHRAARLPSRAVASAVAERLLEELEQPVAVEGLALDVSGSVGIALVPAHAHDAETLLRRADVAMYSAKEAGGGYEQYEDRLDRHNPQRLTLIGQVRPAIERRRVRHFYQPKVRLSDGRSRAPRRSCAGSTRRSGSCRPTSSSRSWRRPCCSSAHPLRDRHGLAQWRDWARRRIPSRSR